MAKHTVVILDWQKMDRDARFDCSIGNVAAVIRAIEAGQFTKYEDVEAENFGHIFALLNGMGLGFEGEFPAFYRNRSMSVGDAIIDENGTVHVCSTVGWKPVDLTTTAWAALLK